MCWVIGQLKLQILLQKRRVACIEVMKNYLGVRNLQKINMNSQNGHELVTSH